MHPARRAPTTTSRSRGTTRSRWSPASCARSRRPTRPSSTRRAARATRRRSSTSCSCGRSARTTCPTARTCATSRAASALDRDDRRRQGHGHPRRHRRRPSSSSSSARTPAPTTRACSPRSSAAKRGGARIVAVNPLPEAGPASGSATRRRRAASSARAPRSADLFLQMRVGGDLALFQAARTGWLLERRRRSTEDVHRRPHRRLRRALAAHLRRSSTPTSCSRPPGSTAADDRASCVDLVAASRAHDRVLGDGADPAPARGGDDPGDRQLPAAARQHRQAGRGALPGARAQQRAGRPHDGHLREAGGRVPRRARRRVRLRAAARRTATTPSTRSGRCATARSTCSSRMGGNFVAAAPDTDVTAAALRRCRLTVQVSTKLNRSHVRRRRGRR